MSLEVDNLPVLRSGSPSVLFIDGYRWLGGLANGYLPTSS